MISLPTPLEVAFNRAEGTLDDIWASDLWPELTPPQQLAIASAADSLLSCRRFAEGNSLSDPQHQREAIEDITEISEGLGLMLGAFGRAPCPF
jgi:hypothetical protein